MKKLAYVDALRGFAVLMVIMTHCGQFGTNNYGFLLETIIKKAQYGVQLFYIASAFTIFLSYSNRIKKEISPNRNFFIRRFFRIAPMYYLAILFYFWQGSFSVLKFSDLNHFGLLSQFFFLHGFNPYWMNSIVPGGWSIAVEMLFYSLIPLLFYLIRNLNTAIVFFLISILLQYSLNSFFIHFPLISDQPLWERYLFYYFPNQLPVFAIGIIFFHLVMQKEHLLNIKPLLILASSILVMLQFYIGLEIVPNFIFISIGLMLFAYFLARQEKNILVNPVIVYLGKVSYSMYLVHFAVIEIIYKIGFIDLINTGNHFTINYFLRLGLVIIITLIISTILYNFIEKPMQKVGGNIIKRLETGTSLITIKK